MTERLWIETGGTASMAWLAQQLQLGGAASVRGYLHQFKRKRVPECLLDGAMRKVGRIVVITTKTDQS